MEDHEQTIVSNGRSNPTDSGSFTFDKKTRNTRSYKAELEAMTASRNGYKVAFFISVASETIFLLLKVLSVI